VLEEPVMQLHTLRNVIEQIEKDPKPVMKKCSGYSRPEHEFLVRINLPPPHKFTNEFVLRQPSRRCTFATQVAQKITSPYQYIAPLEDVFWGTNALYGDPLNPC
jgi:hypothetical protein